MGQGGRATKSSTQHLLRSKRASKKVPFLLERKEKKDLLRTTPFASKKVLRGIFRGLPPFVGGSLVGVWNGWGYGIAIFRALNFETSEPEIWQKIALSAAGHVLEISASEKYFSDSEK